MGLMAATAGSATSWTSVASVIIAATALVASVSLGAWNRKTAKRALELSERQEARRESRLDVHFNDSFAWRDDTQGARFLGFHLIVTNPTDRDSAIVRADLRITYSLDGQVTAVKVPLIAQEKTTVPIAAPHVRIPATLAANNAMSGWFLFRVSDGLIAAREIDRYEVLVRDVHDIEEPVQVTVLHELVS